VTPPAPVPAAGTVPTATGPYLVETRGVSRTYPVHRSLADTLGRRPGITLKAVREVSVGIRAGQVLGVVGETGSGKSTLGRLVLRLERPDSGDVLFEGRSVLDADRGRSAQLRRDVQVILQDPYSSLNPHRSVAATLMEVLTVHRIGDRADRPDRVIDLLDRVGFPVQMRDRRPGQLSGGGRQRVSIARALAVQPRLIVADEPVSALDVSVQAQVLNLFEELRHDLGLTYLFITHDLSVVARLADTIAVMYLGEVVERAPAGDLFTAPLHPYTQALLAAAPELTSRRATARPAVGGEMPDPTDPPPGCPFHTRCASVMDVCRAIRPPTVAVAPARVIACHLFPASPDPASPDLASPDPATPEETP